MAPQSRAPTSFGTRFGLRFRGASMMGAVDVAEPISISTGVANRYATAIFEIAKEDGALASLEADLDSLDSALAGSADLRDLIHSPVYTREEQGAAMAAVAQKMGLTVTVQNALALMAQNRRLFVLPQLTAGLRAKIAEAKGEVTAEVASAKALTKTQADKLAKVIAAQVGKDVKLKTSVDESLIGGLVVKVGSTMIDTSIKAKLAALQNSMKEVG
jgi:F-type H+-transporting ATPase subunit delta